MKKHKRKLPRLVNKDKKAPEYSGAQRQPLHQANKYIAKAKNISADKTAFSFFC